MLWEKQNSVRPLFGAAKKSFFLSHFICLSPNMFSLKKIIHQKMQREKLCNPQRKAYFGCVIFAFKKSKIVSDQFLPLWKDHFFLHEGAIPFFLISFFYHLIGFTKYTKRCAMKSSTIYKVKLNLIVYFFFSKEAKFCETALRSVENRLHRILFLLKTKSTQLKKTLVCKL